MGNCHNCEHFKEGICGVYNLEIHILLEADEYPRYIAKESS